MITIKLIVAVKKIYRGGSVMDPYPVQYLGYCMVGNSSILSHIFNLMAYIFDNSPNDRKTILPSKNFTPAHCFIKHKLKLF